MINPNPLKEEFNLQIQKVSLGNISHELAGLVFMSYSAKYGWDQSLQDIHERGGWGPGEVISDLSRDIVFHMGTIIIEFLEEYGITVMDHTARTNTRALLNEWLPIVIGEFSTGDRKIQG